MSLETFRELCDRGKFYWFTTLEDFDKGIDYNGTKLKGVKFERGVIDNYKNGPYNIMNNAVPTRWSAYGVV